MEKKDEKDGPSIPSLLFKVGQAILKETGNYASGKLTYLIDVAFETAYQKDIAGTVFKYAKEGQEKVKSALKDKVELYDGKLNQLAEEKPAAAGTIDGFVNAYLATPCERSKEPTYNMAVGQGKLLGWTSSFVIFSPVKVGRAAIGLTPYAVRAVKYLQSKVAPDTPEYTGTGTPEYAGGQSNKKTAKKKRKTTKSKSRKKQKKKGLLDYLGLGTNPKKTKSKRKKTTKKRR